jgi:hypothetical protein
MNVYVMRVHQRPIVAGTTEADATVASAGGFDVDLLLHPGGAREWAVCLRRDDDPTTLPGWQASMAAAA